MFMNYLDIYCKNITSNFKFVYMFNIIMFSYFGNTCTVYL